MNTEKELTAMQTMIEFIEKNYDWFIAHSPEYGVVPKILAKATELLTKEREQRKDESIMFMAWKDRHFKISYPYEGAVYLLKEYESVKIIPNVLFGQHYTAEELYDLFKQYN